MGILVSLIAAVLLATPVADPTISFTAPPEVNLSAIRLITCDDETYGTGWMIDDHIMVTAKHVVTPGPCKDDKTGEYLTVYKEDVASDLALVTGKLPVMNSYIKYSCSDYTPGKEYRGYGWSGWGETGIILRQNKVIATDRISDSSYYIRGFSEPWAGMRHLKGWVVPGNSGGPFIADGIAYGITNVGEGGYAFGIPYRAENNYSYPLKNTILC